MYLTRNANLIAFALFGAIIMTAVTTPSFPQVSESAAPDFTVPTLEEMYFTLSEHRGKPVVILALDIDPSGDIVYTDYRPTSFKTLDKQIKKLLGNV